jgi:hypothetical protein
MSSYGYEWVTAIAVQLDVVYDSSTVCDVLVSKVKPCMFKYMPCKGKPRMAQKRIAYATLCTHQRK